MIKDKIQKLMKNENFSDLENTWKELFIKDIGLEAGLVIVDEKSRTKEDSNFVKHYETIIKDIEDSCFVNDSSKGCVITDFMDKNKKAKDFVEEIKKSIIQGLDAQAEYQQIIAIPNTMEKYAALKRTAGLLKSHFALTDDDLTNKSKLKM